MNNKIEVLYNGKYPNTCSGDLIIKIDEKIVYKARHHDATYCKSDNVDTIGNVLAIILKTVAIGPEK